ncbi:Alpha/Beta hydrolase protein [Collybia nuda]|uniref:Alpha/Beta hydrolase protein n=1 Tax=Collybia nuda TaxID=64659 RepID=A0A9P6CDF8_9AGAR|nr:Alpha/Beta hydrolase protein [Collybia nuda]
MKITDVLLAPIFCTLFITASAAVTTTGLAASEVTLASTTRSSISQEDYNSLRYYFKYASSAYVDKLTITCLTSIIQLNNASTGTQGFIAKDEGKKEIIVAFRGSESLLDFYMDVQFDLVPFVVSNIGGPRGVKVHEGSLRGWNGVAQTVNTVVREYLKDGYTLVLTGHSLGGAIASLAGITLNQDLTIRTGCVSYILTVVDIIKGAWTMHSGIRIYTYGQPRTGNVEYAEWVNDKIGTDNLFRVVNFDDP